MTLEEYMDSINPLHAKALRAIALDHGILVVMTEFLPDDVGDDMIKRIKEANG